VEQKRDARHGRENKTCSVIFRMFDPTGYLMTSFFFIFFIFFVRSTPLSTSFVEIIIVGAGGCAQQRKPSCHEWRGEEELQHPAHVHFGY